MSLGPNRALLVALTKQLAQSWDQTRGYWKDAKTREFDLKYMQELQLNVDKTVAVIEQLDKLLMRIRDDCE